MATLTKKDLLEAIEDMPMNAKIIVSVHSDGEWHNNNVDIIYLSKQDNTINIC